MTILHLIRTRIGIGIGIGTGMSHRIVLSRSSAKLSNVARSAKEAPKVTNIAKVGVNNNNASRHFQKTSHVTRSCRPLLAVPLARPLEGGSSLASSASIVSSTSSSFLVSSAFSTSSLLSAPVHMTPHFIRSHHYRTTSTLTSNVGSFHSFDSFGSLGTLFVSYGSVRSLHSSTGSFGSLHPTVPVSSSSSGSIGSVGSFAPFSSFASKEIESDDLLDDDNGNDNNESDSTTTTSSSNTSAPYRIRRRHGVRNVAIVAHVDHGKTTLVDELLKVAASSAPSSYNPLTTPNTLDGVETDDSGGDMGGTTSVSTGTTGTTGERLMDSGELEKERGITITSKVTRLDYHSKEGEHVVINVVDTPGHSDFSGEVDRILSTVSGIILVVDIVEGPKSQTKYVLSRALANGLKPIVVLNKVDRKECLGGGGGGGRLEGGETELEILDLFESLLEHNRDAHNAHNVGAGEGGVGGVDGVDPMEYRTLYASARSGWVTDDLETAVAIAEGREGSEDLKSKCSMRGLLDAILEDIPAPSVHWYDSNNDADDAETREEDFEGEPFSMTATTVGYDSYLGRTCTGRIYSGKVKIGDSITLLPRRDKDAERGGSHSGATSASGTSDVTGPSAQVSGVFANRGISRVPLSPPSPTACAAYAGDIVTLTGVPDKLKVGDTLTSTAYKIPMAIDTPPLAPPTLSCLFGANNGPLAGREGTIVTSSRIRARLITETDNNVTLTAETCESDAEKTVVLGRGELQIGILVEQMRREGFEMILTPPQILTHACPTSGEKMEPFEEVYVDVDSEYSGTVVNALTGGRKGVLVEMSDEMSDGKVRLKFEVPSRGLLGFGPEIATATRGTAVVNHCYLEDRPHVGAMGTGLERGKLVSNEMGKATLFALESLSARGTLFVAPGDMVYPGMIVGENNKSNDLEVNPVRAKATTNMRTQSKDEKLYLPPPKRMSVEELIGYMNEDEVIEVTPQNVRLRKSELDASVRERLARNRKKQLEALKQASSGNSKGGKK